MTITLTASHIIPALAILLPVLWFFVCGCHKRSTHGGGYVNLDGLFEGIGFVILTLLTWLILACVAYFTK